MFGSKSTLTITVKLFSGLDKDARVEGYDPQAGITLQVPSKTRLKKVIKKVGVPDRCALAYFVDGQRAGLWKKLKQDCEIACMRPSAGG